MMKHFFAIFLFIMSYTAFCQEKFSIELTYRENNNDTIYVTVDSGIEEKYYILSDTLVLIEGYYTSNYVSIQLNHPRSSGSLPFYELGLFTNAEKSSLTVSLLPSGEPHLIHKENLFLFQEMGSEAFKEFTKREFDKFWQYYNENVSQLGRNDSITAVTFSLNEAHNLKVTEAILKLEPSYYSFWTFRRQISNNQDVDRDTKEDILLSKFSRYKNTNEYKQVKDLVFGSQIKLGEKINDFESFDILSNNILSLSSLEKPLLLMTWATWCSPCIRKMNILKEISIEYPDLNFIFINMDKDIEKATEFINERSILGNHFSYLNDGIPTMLSNQVVPKIYLLDEDSTVIYNYDLSLDAELNTLREALANYYR